MAIRKVGTFTKTVGREHSGFPGSMVRNWDKPAGLAQARQHPTKREALGQKKTPILAGKMKGK